MFESFSEYGQEFGNIGCVAVTWAIINSNLFLISRKYSAKEKMKISGLIIVNVN